MFGKKKEKFVEEKLTPEQEKQALQVMEQMLGKKKIIGEAHPKKKSWLEIKRKKRQDAKKARKINYQYAKRKMMLKYLWSNCSTVEKCFLVAGALAYGYCIIVLLMWYYYFFTQNDQRLRRTSTRNQRTS